MSLPGISQEEGGDFPRSVRDSVTTLPFRNGGEVTLSTTDVDETLVLVSALRRFENETNVATGADTGAGNLAVLTDSTGDFINKGIEVGDTVSNDTKGETATITAVTATIITGILSSGADWDNGNTYSIDKTKTHQNARAQEIRRLRITTNQDIYVRYDGDASAGQHDLRVDAGEAINEDNIRIVSRISIINVTNPETPTVRFSVAGV